jgi:hypothetical protein
MLQNYRVTFGGEEIDYKSNFSECRKYFDIIDAIVSILEEDTFYPGYIKGVWWFFEPYVEITWLIDSGVNKGACDHILSWVTNILDDNSIEYKVFTPKDGQFADWYGLTPEEREWGALNYNEIKKVATHFYEGKDVVENGLGLERHYMRACHVLANQLGLNYQDESRLLSKRAFLADAFYRLGHEKAIKFYEETYNEKYLGRDS